jgi:hypothetical protein
MIKVRSAVVRNIVRRRNNKINLLENNDGKRKVRNNSLHR